MATEEPNLYVLHGHGLQITLSTTSLTGQPRLTYQDTGKAKQFAGDEITFEDTTMGRLASVVLVSTPDLGSTEFSLVLPAVNLSAGGSQPINTIAITTVRRTTIAGPPRGQSTTFQVARLQGTADQVEF